MNIIRRMIARGQARLAVVIRSGGSLGAGAGSPQAALAIGCGYPPTIRTQKGRQEGKKAQGGLVGINPQKRNQPPICPFEVGRTDKRVREA